MMIGIVGGTFDPIHWGHLYLMSELKRALSLDRILVIPSADPPHRAKPLASYADRCAMVSAAIAGIVDYELDDRESRLGSPSYTIQTLRSLREDYPDDALCFCVGMDAFSQLNTWREWRSLLDYANLVVLDRPGYGRLHPDVQDLLAAAQLKDTASLRMYSNGKIVWVKGLSPSTISSTQIRADLADEQVPEGLPDVVLKYIQAHGLYGSSSK